MAPLTNEDKILTKNSPDLNPVDYSAWCLCNRCVLSQNFRHSPAETSAKLLIDCWAQLSQESDMLNRAIDQLPKRLMIDDGYQGQGWPC